MMDEHADHSLRHHGVSSTYEDGSLAPVGRATGDGVRPDAAEQVVDGAMLQALLILPFQRIEDLALLVGVSLRTAYRHLDHLRACGLIETVVPGNLGRASSQIAYLSRAGVRALAGGEPLAARRLAHAWGTDLRGLMRLLPRLPARITLLQALPTLLLACRRSLASSNGTPFARGTGQGALGRAPLRWYWTLDYHYTFTYRERPRRLSVDAALAVRANGVTDGPIDAQQLASHAAVGWHAVWVLLDPDIGNTGALVPRLSALIAYRESSARWPLYAQFPPVLILTASPHRASLWQHAASEAALRLRADPLAGVIQIAPPGAISCWPMSVPGTPLPQSTPEPLPSWLDLSSGVPTTLASLFAAPLTEAALPPGLTTLPLAPLALNGAYIAATTTSDSDPAGEQIGVVPPTSLPTLGDARAGRGAGVSVTHTPKSEGVRRSNALSKRLTLARQRGQQAMMLDSDQRARRRAALALTLARREETLLDLLARHPLVCQDDLAEWLVLAPTWMDRLRRQLRRAGLVQAFRIPRSIFLPLRPASGATTDVPPGAGERMMPAPAHTTDLLRLTPLAWNYLAAVYQVPARQLAGGAPSARASLIAPSIAAVTTTRVAYSPHLPGKAVHQASVYRFFTLLLQDLDTRAHVDGELRERLLWWETGIACVRRYRCMGRWGTLRPDAAGEYQAGGRRVRFWLEWDTGSMGLERLREKLERYATYAQTTTWRLEDAHSLPVLLIVTPDMAQEERVARLVDELRERARLRWPGPLLIRTTTATRVACDGPLAPIWLPLLPTIALHSDQGGAGPRASAAGDQVPLIRPLERVPPAPRRDPLPRPPQPARPTLGSSNQGGQRAATKTPISHARTDTSRGGAAG